MYREKIRQYYDHLSRSYRKVADYLMSDYYEVSFMTAAQLAHTVGVDTTTVVRFSQRLGYNGYPELLNDVRNQVRTEIYAEYEPKELSPDDPISTFKDRVEHEQQNLRQMLTHCPPEKIEVVSTMLSSAHHIVLVAEGYAESVAAMTAQQLRHLGISAEAAADEPVKRSATLMNLQPGMLVIGISATAYGEAVALALEFARGKDCKTLGIVGSLGSPVNRASDEVIYAPTDASGPLPSVVALVAALSAVVRIASRDSTQSVQQYTESFDSAFDFLTKPKSTKKERELTSAPALNAV